MSYLVDRIEFPKSCPTCGGDLIKYGVQAWSPKDEPYKVRRYQRYQCKRCKRLLYEYIETIDIRKGNKIVKL